MSKYFGTPFANNGDKNSIPDAAQPSGVVSYADGYGPDYEKDQTTDAEAKDVPRQSENQVKFDITDSIRQLQEFGYWPYGADVNYPLNGHALGSDGNVYKALLVSGPDQGGDIDPVGDTTGAWVLAFFGPQNPQARNRIVNPTNAISQENGFGTVFAGVDTNFYVSDEVFTNTSLASNAGVQRSYQTLEGERSVRLLVTTAATDLSASNTAGTFGIKMEKSNLSQLDNGDVAVAFKVRTNWAGKLSLAFRNGALTRSYVTDIDVVSGINQVFKVIPFEADTVGSQAAQNGTGLVVNIGFNNEGDAQQVAANNDAWQAGLAYCSDDSTQWTKTINNYVEITNRDLYGGSVARQFQPNKYQQDLAECKWYFEQLNYKGVTRISIGQATAGAIATAPINYIEKRVDPQIGKIGSILVLTASGGNAGGNISFISRGKNNALIDITGAVGLAQGNAVGIFADGVVTININSRL